MGEYPYPALNTCNKDSVVVAAFQKTGRAPCKPRQASSYGYFGPYDANIIGGSLLGAGMALTGSCPGTVLVQLATGIKTSLYVASGSLVGGILFSRFSNVVKKVQPPPEVSQKALIYQALNFDATKAFFSFEAAYMGIVGLLSILLSRRDYAVVHPVLGGLSIGLAQAATIFLTGSPVGISAVYDHIGQYFWRAVGWKGANPPTGVSNSVFFAAGVMAGGFTISRSLPKTAPSTVDISNLRAFLGGIVLVIGARVAGGCTSGHGISGLSTFSTSSFVAVGSMFAGGILVAAFLR